MNAVIRRVVIVTALGFILALLAPRLVSAQDKGLLDHGVKVYTDQKCSVCHAIGGKGNAKGVLDNIGTTLKAEEIRDWIVNAVDMAKKHKAERKPAMKAYDKLPKEDLDALVAYLASLKK